MKQLPKFASAKSAKLATMALIISMAMGCGSSNDDGFIDTEGDGGDTSGSQETIGDVLSEIGDGIGETAQTGEGAICDDASRNDGWADNCITGRDANSNSLYAQGIQRIVFCLGINPGNSATIDQFADGAFGPNTELAVEEFQSRRDKTDPDSGDSTILVDGIVGPQTWGELEDVLDLPTVFDLNTAAYSVNGVACDTETQFYQNRNTPFDWTMAQVPGSETAVEFSVNAP